MANVPDSQMQTTRSVITDKSAPPSDASSRSKVLAVTAAKAPMGPAISDPTIDDAKELRTVVRDAAAEIAGALLFGGRFSPGQALRRCPDGSLVAFTGTVWEPLTADRLEMLLLIEAWRLGHGDDKKLTAIVSRAIRHVRTLAEPAPDALTLGRPQPTAINFPNGELWLSADGTPKLQRHSVETGFTSVLPFAYDPHATCPLFDAALAAIVRDARQPEQLKAIMLQIIGYFIQPVRNHAVIVIFHGPGANGKSLLARIIERLLPAGTVVHGGVADLKSPLHMARLLLGKRLFVDSDVGVGVVLPDALVKRASESTSLTANLGRQGDVTFANTAALLLLCNELPGLQTLSEGSRRRLMVVPFTRTFAPDEIDVGLFDRIVATELPGIFNRALASWQQLVRDGRFIAVEDIDTARQELVQASSALADFIGDACEEIPGSHTSLTEFFASFELWAVHDGVATGARYALKRNLQQLGYAIKKLDGYYHVAGLKVGKFVEFNA